MLLPFAERFFIFGQAIACIALKNGNIQTVFGNFIYVCKQLPAPRDRFCFEIIAEAPVAQHFKHSMVVGINAHFFQVVVLAAYPETFLCIGNTGIRRFFIAQEIILELVHAGVCK